MYIIIRTVRQFHFSHYLRLSMIALKFSICSSCNMLAPRPRQTRMQQTDYDSTQKIQFLLVEEKIERLMVKAKGSELASYGKTGSNI